MKRLLKLHVNNDMFKDCAKPELTNKRWYPRSSTVRNHMIHSRRRLCRSLIDQECLQLKIPEWKEADPSTKIFFRPKGKNFDQNDHVVLYYSILIVLYITLLLTLFEFKRDRPFN